MTTPTIPPSRLSARTRALEHLVAPTYRGAAAPRKDVPSVAPPRPWLLDRGWTAWQPLL